MASRSLNIPITGDAKGLGRAVKDADRHLDKLGKDADKAGGRLGKIGGVAKVAGLGAAAGVGVAALAMKDLTDAAKESETSSVRMRTQLKAAGLSYRKHGDEIERVIQKQSKLSALDDEDLQDSFTNLVRVTGDVNKALKLNGLAADFARAKGMDVAKAGELIGKVAGGNVGILGRYGIQVKKGATETEALALLQEKFAGQAEAYGDSAAGAQERFAVTIGNVKETLGEALLPTITDVTNEINEFVTGMMDGEGAGGKFADTVTGVFEKVKGVAETVWPVLREGGEFAFGLLKEGFEQAESIVEAFVRTKDKIAGWAEENKEQIQAVVDTVKDALGGAVDWLSSAIPAAFEAVKNAVSDAFQFIADWVSTNRDQILDTAQSIIDGLASAFEAVKGVVVPAFEAVKSAVTAAFEFISDWVSRNRDTIVEVAGTIADKLKSAFNTVKNAVGTAFEAVKNAVSEAVSAIAGWIDEHRDDIAAFGKAWKNIATGVATAVGAIVLAVKWAFENVIAPVIKRVMSVVLDIVKAVWPSIKRIIEGALDALGGVIDIFSGVFTGDFERIWDGVKGIFRGGLKAVRGLLEGAIKGLLAAAKGVGGGIKDGIIAGVKGLARLIGDALVGAVKWVANNLPNLVGEALKGIGKAAAGLIKKGFGALNPIGDGLGGALGDGIGRMFPAFGGGLMGARPEMAPIAGAASRFGLGVSSGRRPGAITSSGNQSYHSTGEALDIAGSPDGMLAFFRFMKNTLGGALAELIYTPGGAGIRNGASHTYSGKVAADHWDHVHVAIDSGVPGVGDGEGRQVGKRSRADEMGWLNAQWEKVAPAFGMDPGKAPLGSLFKHLKLTGRNSFVGVTYDPKASGNETDELLWPSWLWRDSKGQKALDEKTKLKLFVHEMAHRFQDRKKTGPAWKSEGGAEAFARLAMDRFFGGYKREEGDPYSGYTTKVMRDLGTDWVVHGQFGGATGDGIGKDDRSLIQSAAKAGGIGPDILYGVWGAESRFSHGPGPVSKAGAQGPFQFMPDTAKDMGVNPGNLRSSAFGAAKYLGRYKGRGVAGMLAAYNAGPNGNPNNAETQAYIPRVLSFARQWTGGGTSGPSSSGGGKSKSGTASGGPVNRGGIGAVIERAQGLYNPESPSDEEQRARDFVNRTGSFAPQPPRPAKGFTPAEVEQGIPEQIRDRMFPEREAPPTVWDYMDAESASAALSETLEDDKWVAGRRVWHAEQDFAAAQATRDPRKIAAAASRLKSERDTLESLTKALEEGNRIAQERLSLDKEIAGNQRKILALALQGDAILAAVVAAVSGGIGQAVGQSMGTPGFAGGVARY